MFDFLKRKERGKKVYVVLTDAQGDPTHGHIKDGIVFGVFDSKILARKYIEKHVKDGAPGRLGIEEHRLNEVDYV